jgi:hypothetical protein
MGVKTLSEKPEWKGTGRYRRTWEDNIKIKL